MPLRSDDEISDAPEALAYLDDLTGLRNRRYLGERLREGWESMLEQHGEVALLILDLDGFKEVNDRHGHLTGDRVLCDVSRILERSFREDDAVVRYGGDEFVVLLPGAGGDEALALAERARRAVDGHAFETHPEGKSIGGEVSFSVGIASAPLDAAKGEELLAVADRRLFEEKRERSRRHGDAFSFRAWRVAATVLALLLIAAAALWWWWQSVGTAEPTPVGVSPAVLAVRAEGQRQLLQEVESLESRVEGLLAQLAEERSRVRREELAQELAEVEDRLSELEMIGGVQLPGEQGLQEAVGDVPTGESEPVVEVDANPPPREPAARRGTGPDDSVGAGAPEEPLARPSLPEPAGEDPEPVGVEVEPPRLLEMPPPLYPTIGRRLQREATVEVGVVIGPDGTVVEAMALSGPRLHGFREAAVRAAREARFEPGRVEGRPVESQTSLEVRFRLEPEREEP